MAEAATLLQAIEHLRRGGLVAFPTETVYGLGASALDQSAVRRVFKVKGRPSHNPLIVHVAHEAMARRVVSNWSDDAQRLARAFWPGPLTIVAPRHERVPSVVAGGGDTVAVRCPDHPLALELLLRSDLPLVGPSANRSGHVSPTSAEHVRREFAGQILETADGTVSQVGPSGLDQIMLLDGGPCRIGVESTVVLITEQPRILRPGAIGASELSAELGRVVLEATSARADDARIEPLPSPLASPGMLDRHYAPRTPAYAFERHEAGLVLTALGRLDASSLVFALTEIDVPEPHRLVPLPGAPAQLATELYATLRWGDEQESGVMFIELPPSEHTDPIVGAVRDRLRRATMPIDRFIRG
ncbi:MAG: L-threonylcarbamoyladenylate synthase [Planctomycetota bacterium]|nr:L-threonylcarbamoyladenylate synthase [Planctomycetota bacterium]